MTTTEDRIWWQFWEGKLVFGKKRPTTHTYHAHCKIGDRIFSFMHERLGYVRSRHDGRFDWFARPASGRIDWPVKSHRQGVAATLEEAKLIIEGAWRPQGGP